MRDIIQQFKNTIEGQEIFLIGGGPSLKNFDFSLLDDKITIALNSAFLDLHNPTAIYWMDSDWASKNLEELDKRNCFKFTSRPSAETYIKKNLKALGGATVLTKARSNGFSVDIDTVHGNNSGAQALNFLANLKPHRIILLGFDLTSNRGECHYHDRYEISDPRVYEDLFIPSIEAVANGMKHSKIEVINCNLNSKLNCFTKKRLGEYL